MWRSVSAANLKVKKTVAEIESRGREGAFFPADLSLSQDCHALMDFTLERFGGLNVLVNSAAHNPRVLLGDEVRALDRLCSARLINVSAASADSTVAMAWNASGVRTWRSWASAASGRGRSRRWRGREWESSR